MIAFGNLKLLTFCLLISTQLNLTYGSRNDPSHGEGVEGVDTSINRQLTSRKINKRSIDLQTSSNRLEVLVNANPNVQSLNDVNSDEKSSKINSRDLELFKPHRHPDGQVYYYKGYKCVPLSKPSKQLEQLRAHQRSGMLCCTSSMRFLSSTFKMFFFLLNHDELNKHQKSIMFSLYKSNDLTWIKCKSHDLTWWKVDDLARLSNL